MRRLLCALLLTLAFASCTRPEPPPGTAPVTFRVSWPVGAQAIPPAAQSIVVSVAPYADPGTVAASAIIDRPATSAILNAPLGDDLFTARAYDRPGGQGAVLAVGQVRYTVVAGRENVVTLTLGAVVERVALALPKTDLAPGERVQAVATAYDPAGAAVVGASFAFASSDRGVLEIDAQGLVHAVAPGSATLTATETRSGKQATLEVTVTKTVIGVERVELGPGGGSLPAGGSVQLLARALDARGEEVEGAEIRFSSSDSRVLEVDARGRVTARAPGRAVLTASAGGKSAAVTLEVTPASAAPDAARWEPLEPPAYGAVADLARAADGGEFLLALEDEADGASGPYGRPVLYRRAGAGSAWAPVYADGLPASAQASSRLVPHPTDPLELWAELWRPGPSYYPVGSLWRSDNGGRSFRWVLALREGYPDLEGGLAFHPTDPSVLYAGCWRSGDGGASWARITGCGDRFNTVFSPAEPGVLYQVTVYPAPALRRSTDGGKTFHDLTLPRPGSSPASWVRLGVAPGGRVFLSVSAYDPASGSNLHLYRSDDRGDSWSLVESGDHAYGYTGSFVFVPGDPGRVYIWNGGAGPWLYSTDGGLSFKRATLPEALGHVWGSPVPDPAAPGVLYLVKEVSVEERRGQVLRSADHGVSWQDTGVAVNLQPYHPGWLKAVGGGFYVLDRGLWAWEEARGRFERGAHHRGLFTFALLGADRRQPSRVFVAAGGQTYASDDSGLSWAPRPAFPGLYALAQSPADPARWLAAAGVRGDVYASSDDLQTLRRAGRLPLQDGVPVTALALGGARAERAYAATGRGVYRSDDGGAAWRWAGEGLRDADVTDLAVDPADDDRLFAATRGGGVFVSEDGGGSWRAANRGLENRDLSSLCLAADGQTLVAGAHDGGVYVSLDRGGAWSWAGSIPSYAVRDVACDPSDADVVYAATAGGVYKSVDKGATWRLASAGLTSPFATRLWISPDGQTLYAQTADQGVFRGAPAAGSGAGFDLRDAGRRAGRRP